MAIEGQGIEVPPGLTALPKFWAKVVDIFDTGPRGRRAQNLGLRFIDLSPTVRLEVFERVRSLLIAGHARGPSRPPEAEEVTHEAKEVRRVIGALYANGSRLVVRGADQSARRARFEALKFDDRLPIKVAVDNESATDNHAPPPRWQSPPCHLELQTYNSVHRIQVAEIEPDGPLFALGPLQAIHRIRHRRWPRVQPGPNLAISFEFEHPWHASPATCRRVVDLSRWGIAFALSSDREPIYPGLQVVNGAVRIGDGPAVSVGGCVRHVTYIEDTWICGVEITLSPKSELVWRQSVEPVLYPATLSHGAWAEATWQVLTDSGYFNLSGKQPREFIDLKSSFANVAAQLHRAPRVGCNVIWPDGDGIEANISNLKIYSGTWLSHQLARRPGRPSGGYTPKQVLRAIYQHTYEHAQCDPDLAWLIAYAEAGVAWNQLTHLAFANKYAGLGEGYVLPFTLMEGTVGHVLPSPETMGIEVTAGTDTDRHQLLLTIEETYPLAYAQALDLVSDRFDLEQANATLRPAGISRERGILVARRNGSPVATAVLETGEAGTNLFRILDCVRIFPRVGGSELGFGALLVEAARWYAQRGRHRFVYFMESHSRRHAEQVGLRNLGEGSLWIISARLLPDFLEHVYARTAPKKPRTTGPQG